MANTPYYTKAETDALDQELKRQVSTGIIGIVTPNVGGIPQINGASITQNGFYKIDQIGTYGDQVVSSVDDKIIYLEVRNIETTATYELSVTDITLTTSPIVTGNTGLAVSGEVADAIAVISANTSTLDATNNVKPSTQKGTADFVNIQTRSNYFPDPNWETDDYLLSVSEFTGFAGGGVVFADITRNGDGTVSFQKAIQYRFRISQLPNFPTDNRKTGVKFLMKATITGNYRIQLRNNYTAQVYQDTIFSLVADEWTFVNLYGNFTESTINGFDINFVSFPAGFVATFGKMMLDLGVDQNSNYQYLAETFAFKSEIPTIEVTQAKLDAAIALEVTNRNSAISVETANRISEIQAEALLRTNADVNLQSQINATVDQTLLNTTKLNNLSGADLQDETIVYAKLAQSLKEIIATAGGGTINNLPDEKTITTNASNELGFKYIDKLYVDSVNGSDLNDGLFPSHAFKTLAYAQTKIKEYGDLIPLKPMVLYLLGNSVFKRDTLVLNRPRVSYVKYGGGKNPYLTGETQITPTLNSGNVWEFTATYVGTFGRPTVFEDGWAMQPVANISECQALPNSYVVTVGDEIPAGTYTIQFHPSDSGNPTSNGKIYTTNTHPVVQSSTIETNIIEINFDSIDTAYGFNPTTFAPVFNVGAHLRNVRSDWGTKHNFHVDKNTIIENCHAFGSEIHGEYTKFGELFVCYSTTANTGGFVKYKNCSAIMPVKKVGFELGLETKAFFDHHAGSEKLDLVQYDDCFASGVTDAIACNSLKLIVNRGYFEKLSGQMIRSPYNSDFNSTFLGGESFTDVASLPNENYTHNFNNCIILNMKYSTNGIGELNLNNCIISAEFLQDGIFGGGNFMPQAGTNASNVTSYGCVYMFHTWGLCVKTGKYQGDYNIFGTGSNIDIRNALDNVGYSTLSAWQTATGQDVNSVYLSKEQQRNFLIKDPKTGDAIINPQVKVTKADGTILNAVFADGTSIFSKITNKQFSERRSILREVGINGIRDFR